MNASESNKMKFLKVRLESRLKLLTEFLEKVMEKGRVFLLKGGWKKSSIFFNSSTKLITIYKTKEGE